MENLPMVGIYAGLLGAAFSFVLALTVRGHLPCLPVLRGSVFAASLGSFFLPFFSFCLFPTSRLPSSSFFDRFFLPHLVFPAFFLLSFVVVSSIRCLCGDYRVVSGVPIPGVASATVFIYIKRPFCFRSVLSKMGFITLRTQGSTM